MGKYKVLKEGQTLKQKDLKGLYHWTDNTSITATRKMIKAGKVHIFNLNKKKKKVSEKGKSLKILTVLKLDGGDARWMNEQFTEFCKSLKVYEAAQHSARRRLFELKRKLYRFKHARR